MNRKGSDTFYDAWLINNGKKRAEFQLASVETSSEKEDLLPPRNRKKPLIVSEDDAEEDFESMLDAQLQSRSQSLPQSEDIKPACSRQMFKAKEINQMIAISSDSDEEEEVKFWQVAKFLPKKIVKNTIVISDDE